MLPRADDVTLSRYLLSAAATICEQVNLACVTGDAATRLRECAAIAARVAQQIDDRALAAAPDAAAEADALETEEAIFAAANARRIAGNGVSATVYSRRLDPAALEAYLRGHTLGAPDLRVTEARLLPGGRCKLTALVSQRGSARLPRSFILRQDWEGGATNTTVAGEFLLLERVVAGGVRAPRPLLLEPDATVLGAPFILLERMAGKPIGGLFDPPRSRTLAVQLAEQLGRLHGIAGDFDAALPPEDRSQCLAAFRAMQAAIGIECLTIEAAMDWLAEHLDDAGTTTRLIHNDVGFHNALVDGEELTALLDWELAQPGHPAADLGYIKHFVAQMMDWSEWLEYYVQAGGWKPEPAVLRFHTVWNAVRLYGLIMQARASLAAGRVDDIEIAFACADNLMLLVRFLARELRDGPA